MIGSLIAGQITQTYAFSQLLHKNFFSTFPRLCEMQTLVFRLFDFNSLFVRGHRYQETLVCCYKTNSTDQKK